MKKASSLLFCVIALALAGLACNFPTARLQVSTGEFNQSVASTVTTEVGPDATAMVEATTRPPAALAGDTNQATVTPTITPTPTSMIPVARVLQNTNCRSGPGTVYDLIYIAMTGDEAEITARSSAPNYTVIDVPDGSGRECWLWMEYSEQEGSTDDLPLRTPPPTPTPIPTETPAFEFSIAFEDFLPCFSKTAIYVRVVNTGSLKLESFSFTAEDIDSSETVAYQENSFGHSVTCPTLSDASINPGGHGYLIVMLTPPNGGHTVKLNAKICNEDNLAGVCMSKSLSIDIPSISDVQFKENLEPVDGRTILERLAELPITSWNYTASGPENRHIGPMAQDFNPMFGVGEYEDAISSVDSSGVALAAIQALKSIADEQDERISDLEARYDRMLDQLEAQDAPARSESDGFWYALLPLVALAGLGAGWVLGRSSKSRVP